MKPASQITDRAKRYRAQKNKPQGPRRCNFCARRNNIDVDHITGDERDGDELDLIYLCRSCNTRKGITQARNRIGVRTRQYNPRRLFRAPTWTDFKRSVRILLGIEPGDAGEATNTIRRTTPAQRIRFGDKIEAANPFKSEAQRRKFGAMLSRGEIDRKTFDKFAHGNPAAPTFAQYAHGVSIHRRGAIDEGGAIIHATPKALRSKYAREIARKKAASRSEVPF